MRYHSGSLPAGTRAALGKALCDGHVITSIARGCLLALVLLVAHGGAEALAADIQGSRDHPLMSRYEGSRIIAYKTYDYDEYVLGLASAKEDDKREVKFLKSQTVEGKITRIMYAAPVQHTPLQVFRSYEQALEKGGFQTLFKCVASSCGKWIAYAPMFAPKEKELLEFTFGPWDKDHRLVTARLARAGGDVYLSLLVYNYGGQRGKEFADTIVMLDVIETKAMRTGMVKVTAETLAKDIRAAGKVAIYEIYFDTDSDKLKTESDAALNEIGRMMREQSALKVFIVGHTDLTGSFEHNLDLSRRRARAVADALAKRFGVNAERMVAHGVGPLAPVVSNESENGRALNRRVELVAR